MNHQDIEKELTLAAPVWIKIGVTVAYLLPIILLFFEDWHSFVEGLNPSRYPFRWMAFGLAVIGGPFLCLFILFTKTVLTETEIVHRNLLFKTTRMLYGDVVNVEITRRMDILIAFRNGTKIKANTGESRLDETIRFLTQHVSGEKFAKR
jgi:hypothetical protein